MPCFIASWEIDFTFNWEPLGRRCHWDHCCREPPGMSPFSCSVDVCGEISGLLFPGTLSVSNYGRLHVASNPPPGNVGCLSARSHCMDRKCIHNTFLLFARQKMVLVLVSCWLAPVQRRSEWVLFSFRSCESDAFPPCWASLPNTCIETLHDHQFVRWLYCSKESVQVFCIFFFSFLSP